MAFNPFHGFRKHKKTIFAILTIICMFTFVLSGGFGRGDAFEWFLAKIGASSKQGQVVCKLYGDKVYEGQLGERRRLREIANRYITNVLENPEWGSRVATMNAISVILQQSPPTQPGDDRFGFRRAAALFFFEGLIRGVRVGEEQMKAILDKDPMLASIRQEAFNNYIRSLQSPRDRFESLKEEQRALMHLRSRMARKNQKDETDILDGILSLRALEMWALQGGRAGGEFLFGGSAKTQDLLDFTVWLKQADTLGIKFTQEDVRNALRLLSPSRPPLTGKKGQDQLSLTADREGREQVVDLSTLYRALTDEFRVVLARGIITGSEPGLFRFRPSAFREPLSITPGQYVDYYREQRRGADIVLLPIPVRQFLSSDKLKEPTEAQLDDLFRQYNQKVPQPSSPLPGFKIPQKVRVQWMVDGRLSVPTLRAAAQAFPMGGFLRSVEDAREFEYLQRADRQVVQSLASAVGLGTSHLLIGVGVAGQTTGLYQQAFTDLRTNFPVPSLLQADPALAFASAQNLQTVITGGVGLAAAANPVVPVLGWQGSAYLRGSAAQEPYIKEERTKRARLVGGLVGSSLTSPLASLAPWAGADYQGDTGEYKGRGTLKVDGLALEPFVPMQAIRNQVIEEAHARLGKTIQRNDLEEFQKKFEAAKGEEEEARKVIAEFAKKMGLQSATGESRFDGDVFTLASDPGLRPLFRAFLRQNDALQSQPFRRQAEAFGQHVLRLPGAFMVARETGWGGHRIDVGDSTFWFWLTRNEPARTPSFGEARETVRRAWLEQEARKLARKEADAIREELKGKDAKEALHVLEALLAKNPNWGHLIRWDKVERQERQERLVAGGTYLYKPFQVPAHDIEYPPAGFIDNLMKLGQGQAGVFKDEPEMHFYVAFIVKAIDAPPLDTALNPEYRRMLWEQLYEEQQEEKSKAIMEELRRQAGTLDARGRFELNPGIKSDEASDVASRDE
jgi:hypothetical protein